MELNSKFDDLVEKDEIKAIINNGSKKYAKLSQKIAMIEGKCYT